MTSTNSHSIDEEHRLRWSRAMLKAHSSLLDHLTRKRRRATQRRQRRDHLAEQCVAAWLAERGLLAPTSGGDDAVLDLDAVLRRERLGIEVKSNLNDIGDRYLRGALGRPGLRDVVADCLGPEFGVTIEWGTVPEPRHVGRFRDQVVRSVRESLGDLDSIPAGHCARLSIRLENEGWSRPVTLTVRVERQPFVSLAHSRTMGDGWDVFLDQILDHASSKDLKSRSQGDTRPFILVYHRFSRETARFDTRQLGWAQDAGLFKEAPARLVAVLLMCQREEEDGMRSECAGIDRRGGTLLEELGATGPSPRYHVVRAADAWSRLAQAVDEAMMNPSSLIEPIHMADAHRLLRAAPTCDTPGAPNALKAAMRAFACEGRPLCLFESGEQMPEAWCGRDATGLPCLPTQEFVMHHRRPRALLQRFP